MSFRCGGCGENQKRRTKAVKVVTEVRKVIYIQQGVSGNPETQGWEPFVEVQLCPNCSEKYPSGYQPTIVEKVRRVEVRPPLIEVRPPLKKGRKRRRKRQG